MKYKILITILAIAAVVSVSQGFYNALQYSQDFQWSPTKLLWEGINPYTYYASGNKDGRIILSQIPNYAHVTYILLFPFSLMNWETAKFLWATTNLILAVQAVRIICRNAELTTIETLAVLFIFLCSTPLRNTIGNGQHALIVLICYCALLYPQSYINSAIAGIGYFKYSFMPPVFLFLAFKRGLVAAMISTIACTAGWIAFTIVFATSPLEILISPLLVSKSAVGNGIADLMTIIGFLYANNQTNFSLTVKYLTPLLTCALLAWYSVKSNGSRLFELSFISIACLITFKHLGYDFVLLLPAFAYAYKYISMVEAKLAICAILFNWFGQKAITPLNFSPELLTTTNFAICAALMLLIARINRKLQSNPLFKKT